MAKTINEALEFENLTKEELFNIFTDSEKLFEITEYKTTVGVNRGDRFKALNGAVVGKNLYVVPGRMLVIVWRWLSRKEKLNDSLITLVFNDTGNGCRLEASHINLQNTEEPFMNKDTYWGPITEYTEKISRSKKTVPFK